MSDELNYYYGPILLLIVLVITFLINIIEISKDIVACDAQPITQHEQKYYSIVDSDDVRVLAKQQDHYKFNEFSMEDVEFTQGKPTLTRFSRDCQDNYPEYENRVIISVPEFSIPKK